MLIELCPSWSFTQLKEISDGLLINLSKMSQLHHIHPPLPEKAREAVYDSAPNRCILLLALTTKVNS